MLGFFHYMRFSCKIVEEISEGIITGNGHCYGLQYIFVSEV
jgi:hypothetical protein